MKTPAPDRVSGPDGRKALEIARNTVNLWVTGHEKFVPEKYPPRLDEHGGVFTTILTYPSRMLRGCIGYPEPFMPIIRSLINSAIHATQDPRFPRLTREELCSVVVEVSLLTKPVKLEVQFPEQYLDLIKIGRHGLIVRKWSLSGLLLPQVATEHGMTQMSFLEHTCMKACLPTDAWKDPGTSVYVFESQIFSERKPPRQGKPI
jgi:hypothetical protein